MECNKRNYELSTCTFSDELILSIYVSITLCTGTGPADMQEDVSSDSDTSSRSKTASLTFFSTCTLLLETPTAIINIVNKQQL